MPLQLQTPFDPGDQDPGVLYAYAKITKMMVDLDEKKITVWVTYGTMAEGVWAKGKLRPTPHTIQNIEQVLDVEGNEVRAEDLKFDAVVAQKPTNLTDTLYDQNALRLYQHLVSEGILTGTVV